MGKLIKLKVLIVGQRGLGVECAKNLILAGPASVDLYDPTIVTINDMGSNFYIRDSHIGLLSRAQASVDQLRELNPYVKVAVIDKLSLDDHKNYNVVCYTENLLGLQNLKEVNQICRQNKIGFVLSETLGLVGYAFVDFGEHHLISDHDGEATKSFIVTSISQEEQATITVHDDKRHSYQEGDFVKFIEVEGMTEINNREPIEIVNVKGPFSFQIKLDTREFGAYTRQGIVENQKVPKPASFHSLEQSYVNPVASSACGMLETPDLRNWGRSDQIYVAVRAVHAFHQQHGRYPNSEDVEQVSEISKAINTQAKDKQEHFVEQLEDDVVKKTAMFATSSLVPQAAFFGGIIAQEIVKFTGKYTPLKQWLYYDIFETLPEGPVDRTPLNSRYDDQIKVYGREIQEKLGKVKTFMVGAGALGCEYIKAFALMGLGCGPEGRVHCTDNDNIEISNLNRQFLFRKNHVGKSKSQTACQIAQGMNPDLKVQSYTTYVAPETEAVFNDPFWESLDFIVNAVDNIKARLYVDARCVWYEKPLLESGTLGTKANSQMIVPHKTLCYGDSQDPPEESIPMCTMRNFPNLIEHCIEWGRDSFNSMFVTRAQDALNFIENPDAFLAGLRQNTTSSGARESLAEIKKILNLKTNADFASCLQVARDLFDSFFNHAIRDLIGMFAPDSLDSHGQPFWSGPKRCPDPITFNADDATHLMFVMSCANLIAFNLGIPQIRDANQVKQISQGLQSKPYVKKEIVVETPEQAKAREEAKLPPPVPVVQSSVDDEEAVQTLMNELKELINHIRKEDLQAAEFEKDDETNFHIDYIHATAQLRARNYKITECDFGKTKMIAGKIIPAIATTTAMITGAVAAEFFKYVQNITDLSKFKNSFVNLALPLFVFSEPDPIKTTKSKDYDPIMGGAVKAIPEGFTIYDKVTIKQGSLTFQQLFDWLKENQGIDVSMVACGRSALYNAYLPGQKHKPRLNQKVEDVYFEVTKEELPKERYYLVLEVSGETLDDGSDFTMPPIKYCFKQ